MHRCGLRARGSIAKKLGSRGFAGAAAATPSFWATWRYHHEAPETSWEEVMSCHNHSQYEGKKFFSDPQYAYMRPFDPHNESCAEHFPYYPRPKEEKQIVKADENDTVAWEKEVYGKALNGQPIGWKEFYHARKKLMNDRWVMWKHWVFPAALKGHAHWIPRLTEEDLSLVHPANNTIHDWRLQPRFSIPDRPTDLGLFQVDPYRFARERSKMKTQNVLFFQHMNAYGRYGWHWAWYAILIYATVDQLRNFVRNRMDGKPFFTHPREWTHQHWMYLVFLYLGA